MVITNNDITQKNYKKLSIQVSLNGLSFCVFDLLTNKIITFNTIDFVKNIILEESLWKTFVDNPILSDDYDKIMVVHDNNLNTFVPEPLFDTNSLSSYLQYNVKVFSSDYFTSDHLQNQDLYNVYVPYININNFLLDQFKTFDFKNSNTILIKRILESSSFTDEKQIYVHFTSDKFEIIVTKGKQLLLFNSFEYKTPEDFIYYILFTFEQLQLNPDSILLHFLGDITTESEYYKIAYKYIRNCKLFNTFILPTTFGKTESEIRKHFILFHS